MAEKSGQTTSAGRSWALRGAGLVLLYVAVLLLWFAGATVIPGFPAFDERAIIRPLQVAFGCTVLWTIYRTVREYVSGAVERDTAWTDERLNRAFVVAGLLDEEDAGAGHVHLAGGVGRTRSRGGGVERDEDGVTLAVRLPQGLVVSAVEKRREQLAAALHVPMERFHLSRWEGRANVLRVRVEHEEPPLARRTAVLPALDDAGAGAGSWRSPVLLGRDARGRDVTAPVYDVGQWLVGGITGSGKTTLLRLLAAHYALDPTAVLWGCDGKGSRDDWGPLRRRCGRWVDVTDPNSSGAYLDMLRDVATLVTDRNREGGRDHPGMLVILEEATALRAALDRSEQAEADRHLTRIVQTCRSANVLVVTAAQRPSSGLMSTNVRAQAGVGVCMRVRSETDAEMVLGYRPETRLPEKVGQALVDSGDGHLRRILVDYLDDAAWESFCAAVSRRGLRVLPGGGDGGPGPLDVEDDEERGPQDAPRSDEEEPDWPDIPEVLAAVGEVLLSEGRAMTAGELWERLPEGLRDRSPAYLGRKLAALGLHSEKRYLASERKQARVYDLEALDALVDLWELEGPGAVDSTDTGALSAPSDAPSGLDSDEDEWPGLSSV